MQHLALFPLQLVVFPGEGLNLHIFEPRYRQLVAEAETDGIHFGVPTVINGELQPVATEVSLENIARKYPSGESDIETLGRRVFRIDAFEREVPDKLYSGARVTYLTVDTQEDPEINREIIALTREIYGRLKIEREIATVEEGFTTYDIGHYVGLTLDQEYTLLTLLGAEERQQYLLTHLTNIKPQLGDPLGIRERAKLNGHFKELQPPDF